MIAVGVRKFYASNRVPATERAAPPRTILASASVLSSRTLSASRDIYRRSLTRLALPAERASVPLAATRMSAEIPMRSFSLVASSRASV
jgi:hypothetical protein